MLACWPLYEYKGRRPVISSGFGPRARNTYSCGLHLGADIDYRWEPGDPVSAPLASTDVDRNGNRHGYVTPSGTMACAAAPGRVLQSARNSRGWGVVLEHDGGWITWYQHLRSSPLRRGALVDAAAALGPVGADESDTRESGAEGFRHLHFALAKRGAPSGPTECHDLGRRLGLGFSATALDPAPYLAGLPIAQRGTGGAGLFVAGLLVAYLVA